MQFFFLSHTFRLIHYCQNFFSTSHYHFPDGGRFVHRHARRCPLSNPNWHFHWSCRIHYWCARRLSLKPKCNWTTIPRNYNSPRDKLIGDEKKKLRKKCKHQEKVKTFFRDHTQDSRRLLNNFPDSFFLLSFVMLQYVRITGIKRQLLNAMQRNWDNVSSRYNYLKKGRNEEGLETIFWLIQHCWKRVKAYLCDFDGF